MAENQWVTVVIAPATGVIIPFVTSRWGPPCNGQVPYYLPTCRPLLSWWSLRNITSPLKVRNFYTNSTVCIWKMDGIGRLLSFWEGLLSGAFAVCFREGSSQKQTPALEQLGILCDPLSYLDGRGCGGIGHWYLTNCSTKKPFQGIIGPSKRVWSSTLIFWILFLAEGGTVCHHLESGEEKVSGIVLIYPPPRMPVTTRMTWHF